MGRLIRRAPDKTCDNLLPLAIVLTVLSFFTHWRWYWRYIRTGEVD
jgi:hypothetical protein